MKKIFIILLLGATLSFPEFVFAKTGWTLLEEKNALSLEGRCLGQEVRVELFPRNKREPVYTSGAPCLDGNFTFSDNLLQWEGLSDGEYRVVIDGDTKHSKNISVKRPVAKAAPAVATAVATEEIKTPAVLSPEIKFLGAFVALEQSILDMRQWLSEADYPAPVKVGMGIALDGLDLAVSKVSDLVLLIQSGASIPEETKAQGEGSGSGTPVTEVPPVTTETESTEQIPSEVITPDTLPEDSTENSEEQTSASSPDPSETSPDSSESPIVP